MTIDDDVTRLLGWRPGDLDAVLWKAGA